MAGVVMTNEVAYFFPKEVGGTETVFPKVEYNNWVLYHRCNDDKALIDRYANAAAAYFSTDLFVILDPAIPFQGKNAKPGQNTDLSNQFSFFTTAEDLTEFWIVYNSTPFP